MGEGSGAQKPPQHQGFSGDAHRLQWASQPRSWAAAAAAVARRWALRLDGCFCLACVCPGSWPTIPTLGPWMKQSQLCP